MKNFLLTIAFLSLFISPGIFAQVNNCLAFDGVNDYVNLDLNDNLSNRSQITIEMWVNLASIRRYQSFFHFGTDLDHRIELQDGGSGALIVFVSNGNSTDQSVVTFQQTVTAGKWYHLALVFDGTLSDVTKRLKLYLNGEEYLGDYDDEFPAKTPTISATATLGKGSDAGNYFQGKMDEVRIWYTEARTQEEIQDNMNSTLGTRDNLLASYHFDEGTAGGNNAGVTTLNDKSGATNHSGTLVNFSLSGTTSNWVSRVYPTSVDNCLQFDGTNDYVNLGGLGSEIDDSGLLTVETWVNAATLTDYATLFSKYYSNESRTQIQLRSTGNLLITIEQGTDAVVSQAYTTTAPITSGNWFHLAMVFDGLGADNAAKLKLYINGQAVALSYVGTINLDLNHTVYPALLGAQGSSLAGGAFSNYFSGLMDEVKIWNVARTQVQVQQNMFSPVAGTEAGLVAYYNFNQEASNSNVTVLNDLSVESIWNSTSAEKNFGVLTNFALTGSTSNFVASTFILGSGTEGDPYQIANLNNLYWIAASSDRWNKYYKQTADIDASSTSTWDGGEGWIPIGNETTKFTGSFDGDGHTISSLYIYRIANYTGFFGSAGYPSFIRKLGLVNIDITGAHSTGGLIGDINSSTVSQCYTTGIVTGSQNIGGFAGLIWGNPIYLSNISNCYSTASVSGYNYVGGFAGDIGYATVNYSYSIGGVTATTTPKGGFAGFQELNVTATACFWDTETSGQGSSALGTGKTTTEMKTITTFSGAGWGMIGCNPTWNMSNGRNSGYPYLQWQYPTDNPASIPPSAGSGTSGSPYEIANLNNLLWIAGDNTKWSAYYKQTANIDMSCSETWNSGAGWSPIGYNSIYKFTGSYDGDGHTITGLYINRPTTHTIGFFGYTDSPCSITKLGLVDVNIIGINYTGALVGNMRSSNVSKCFTTGSVTGVGSIGGFGGFAGLCDYSNISDCYTRASVTGSNYVGGFIGLLEGGTMNFTYSTGVVTGATFTGGFIGSTSGATVTNSYWDTQTSGKGTSAAGTGKTTTEMKTNSTFLSAGWDDTIWNMGDGINDGYPYLDWQNPGGTAMPVELSSFSATTEGSKVNLSWSTATEVNNYGFEVERKVGSLQPTVGNYEKIGFVNGNGNSNSPKSYSYEDKNINSGKYSYRLKQIDNDGQFEYSKSIEVDLNGVKKFELSQNYPNPFNPSTTIRFNLPEAGNVKLTLFNILGQEVRTLVNEVKEAGTHTINFNASDLNSGVYIYKIESGSFTQTRKMSLIK